MIMRIVGVVSLLTVLISVASCGSQDGFELRNGDLIFQVGNVSAMTSAISEATVRDRALSLTHVGIVAMDGDVAYVVEASPRGGVVRSTVRSFLESSGSIEGRPAAVVMRLKEPFDDKMAVRRALEHLGEPYDWAYRHCNGQMYCSELVYDSYLDSNGYPLFLAHPMNFRNADGTMPQFWTDLFSRLGEPIPEGEPGTNPNDMARSTLLQTVHRYYLK